MIEFKQKYWLYEIVILTIIGTVLISGCVERPAGEPVEESQTEVNITLEERKETSTQKLLSWQKEDGIRIPNAISSSTIFRGNEYWMYYTGNGIELAISNDGISFVLKGSVVRDDGPGSEQEMVTNPAVFQIKNGRYRMLYEGSKDNQAVRKLYSAVSDDGLKWFKEEGVRLEDTIFWIDQEKKKKGETDWRNEIIFTSVPDVIRIENCLRLYYTVIDEIRMAKSCDEGLTWEKEGKIIFEFYHDVAQDPDIIQLEDGTYKLFFSAQDFYRRKGWIEIASSEDGINFKVDGEKRIEPSHGETHAMDIDVIKLPDGTYRAYYSEGTFPNPKSNILSAISQD